MIDGKELSNMIREYMYDAIHRKKEYIEITEFNAWIQKAIMVMEAEDGWCMPGIEIPVNRNRVLMTVEGSTPVAVGKELDQKSFEAAVEEMKKKMRYVTTGFYAGGEWYDRNGRLMEKGPIAWKSLPEPYEGEDYDIFR